MSNVVMGNTAQKNVPQKVRQRGKRSEKSKLFARIVRNNFGSQNHILGITIQSSVVCHAKKNIQESSEQESVISAESNSKLHPYTMQKGQVAGSVQGNACLKVCLPLQ